MPFVTFETKPYEHNMVAQTLAPLAVLWNQGPHPSLTIRDTYTGPNVRRPVTGLTLKERRPAYFTVLTRTGAPVLLYNSLGGREAPETEDHELRAKHYTDFTLVSVRMSRAEKVQLIQTFGEDFAFFCGEQPMIVACSGLLVNSLDFNWRAQFWENYDKYLRGTKLVEMRARVYLAWDDVVVEGYMLGADAVDSADAPHSIGLQFQLLLTDYQSLAITNLSIYQAHREALVSGNLYPDEHIGSRAAEVTANGEYVELGPSFWQRQVQLFLGVNSIEEAMAQLAANPQSFIAARKDAMLGYLQTGALTRNATQEFFPGPAPLRRLLTSAHDDAHQVDGLSNRLNARKVFGAGMQSCFSLCKVAL